MSERYYVVLDMGEGEEAERLGEVTRGLIEKAGIQFEARVVKGGVVYQEERKYWDKLTYEELMEIRDSLIREHNKTEARISAYMRNRRNRGAAVREARISAYHTESRVIE